VVELLRHCLDGYAYQRLDDEEPRRREAESRAVARTVSQEATTAD